MSAFDDSSIAQKTNVYLQLTAPLQDRDVFRSGYDHRNDLEAEQHASSQDEEEIGCAFVGGNRVHGVPPHPSQALQNLA
jgi:urease accessory protein UreH